jgi:hypothetical protein
MTATRFSYEQSGWRPPDSDFELERRCHGLRTKPAWRFWGLRPKECSSDGRCQSMNSSQAPDDDETLTQPVNVDAPEPQV